MIVSGFQPGRQSPLIPYKFGKMLTMDKSLSTSTGKGFAPLAGSDSEAGSMGIAASDAKAEIPLNLIRHMVIFHHRIGLRRSNIEFLKSPGNRSPVGRAPARESAWGERYTAVRFGCQVLAHRGVPGSCSRSWLDTIHSQIHTPLHGSS